VALLFTVPALSLQLPRLREPTKQDGPAKEGERQKKHTDDLEMARQRKLKQFSP